ncbi:MAG: hypothetical protein IJ439_02570 [Tyzzerella sp.]|nr:hypothetical protein [Tyzzerella sp.]
MNSKAKNIEEHYFDLVESIGKENIDFFGINVIDADERDLIYKIYHSEKVSRNRNHPLVEFVYQKEMLRYFADVTDSEHPELTRLDISLYNRNDSNMNDLFDYLLQTVPYFKSHVFDVKMTSKMKITDVQDYHFASLYHVGLIENKKVPELLKFHFFTRWCIDPNHHTKEGYRDAEYLAYLKSINIKEYLILAEKAAFLLEKCGGHLWMAGMDISHEKTKYKIYLKNISNAYKYLPHILGEAANKHLQEIECWNDKHKECRLAGIAIALDSYNVSSLNLYYHLS